MDILRYKHNYTYSILTTGQSSEFTVSDTDYSFKVKVQTIGVEKANTIAIYETNGTVFNGHYQEQERMNIIQLYEPNFVGDLRT